MYQIILRKLPHCCNNLVYWEFSTGVPAIYTSDICVSSVKKVYWIFKLVACRLWCRCLIIWSSLKGKGYIIIALRFIELERTLKQRINYWTRVLQFVKDGLMVKKKYFNRHKRVCLSSYSVILLKYGK